MSFKTIQKEGHGAAAGAAAVADTHAAVDGKPQLKLRGDRYRAFLEFLPDPVFVFNLDSTVYYLNPAFERVFGWPLEEWRGKTVPFIPEHLKAQTRDGVRRLFRDKVIHGFETQRLTRDGRLLDVLIDAAVYYDETHRPAGKVVTYRDITRQKRTDRSNQAFFRIAKALYQYRGLDKRLGFITRELMDVMAVEGALVILVDEERQEFLLRAAAYHHREAQEKYRETRYPLTRGVAGEVVRTGKPMIVHDYYDSPFFFEAIDQRLGFKTKSMLQVPMRTEDRLIGTLCVVNKREEPFDQTDVDLLETIASIVALPIVNARINEALEKSYEEVKSLNRAKDRVIHHLSHELKTPVSVLDASLGLLGRHVKDPEHEGTTRIFDRARRNLRRILEIQYQTEDILRDKDYGSHRMLTAMLESCEDELEALVADELDRADIGSRIRKRIDAVFGPREAVPEVIPLDRFTDDLIRALRPEFAHRGCRLVTRISPAPPVRIPSEVLKKIVVGLVRNAVENTPDGGRIVVAVGPGADGAELTVSDYGVGFTREKRHLFFENFFTSYDTMRYASGTPYDFNAGGRGFDLLRMKIFSERYRFAIKMRTRRCRFIPGDRDVCPGDVDKCEYCQSDLDCIDTGGTMIRLSFAPATEPAESEGGDDAFQRGC